MDGAEGVGTPGHIGNVRDERAELRFAFPQRRLGLQARRDVAEAPYPADRVGVEGSRCAVALDVAAVEELERFRQFLAVAHSLDGLSESLRILDQLQRVLEALVRVARFA